MRSAPSPFGEKLRLWRKRRGMSQLDLALAAETTARHVSFVETGRSRPGRGLVFRFAEALQLSLRDRNRLLVAAGLPPVYAERRLDDAALGPVRAIIDRVLRNHAPYPAFAFGPGLQMLTANAAAERLYPGLCDRTPTELITAWCTRQPEQSPDETRRDAWRVVSMLRRDLGAHPHPSLPGLLDLAEGLARGLGPPPEPPADEGDGIVMCSRLMVDGEAVDTIATVMRFDKATDVTVAELRVELIFPADDHADAVFRALAAG